MLFTSSAQSGKSQGYGGNCLEASSATFKYGTLNSLGGFWRAGWPLAGHSRTWKAASETMHVILRSDRFCCAYGGLQSGFVPVRKRGHQDFAT
jgi:hypothetical protein